MINNRHKKILCLFPSDLMSIQKSPMIRHLYEMHRLFNIGNDKTSPHHLVFNTNREFIPELLMRNFGLYLWKPHEDLFKMIDHVYMVLIYQNDPNDPYTQEILSICNKINTNYIIVKGEDLDKPISYEETNIRKTKRLMLKNHTLNVESRVPKNLGKHLG